MYSLHLLIEIKLHMKLCWYLFHCICCFLEYLWIKCPLNSLLLVPWSKINGNFRFVTSSFKNLVAPFCFCSAKRCKFYGATFESNFSLCDFICCRSKIIKLFGIFFFFYILCLHVYLHYTYFLHDSYTKSTVRLFLILPMTPILLETLTSSLSHMLFKIKICISYHTKVFAMLCLIYRILPEE